MLPVLRHRVDRRQVERLAAADRARELELQGLGALRDVSEGANFGLESLSAPWAASHSRYVCDELEAGAELPQRREGVLVEGLEARLLQQPVEVLLEARLEGGNGFSAATSSS